MESVRVDVLVTENGKSVLGLRPADFDVRDNGVPQQVDLATYEEIPLNVILALDMSGSLDAKALEHLRSAGKMLLNGLRHTDQSALVTFNEAVSQGATLTSDVERVRAALDQAVPAGQTSLVDASFAGMMIGESDVGRSLLMQEYWLVDPERDVINVYRAESGGIFAAPVEYARTAIPASLLFPGLELALDRVFA